MYLVDDCRWLGALEETNRHRVDAHVTYKKYSDQGTTFFLQYPDLVSNTNIVSLALSCCTIFIYSPNLPVLYTVTEAYQICSSLWDKGTVLQHFLPHLFSSFEQAWATDQWVKTLSNMVLFSPRYSYVCVEKTDCTQYCIILRKSQQKI